MNSLNSTVPETWSKSYSLLYRQALIDCKMVSENPFRKITKENVKTDCKLIDEAVKMTKERIKEGRQEMKEH